MRHDTTQHDTTGTATTARALCHILPHAHREDDFAGLSRITAPVLRSALTVMNFFGIPELKNTLFFLTAPLQ